MSAPEFSRTVRVDTLGPEPRRLAVEAGGDERAELAKRFGLAAIGSLAAEAALSRSGETVTASGELKAEVTQSCIGTGEPLSQRIEEPFTILFRPAPDAAAPEEEIELSQSELDVIFYDGAMIDLGEAIAQMLAVSIDPWPRSPGADEALREAGVKSEEEAGPFAALAALRDKLGK